MNKLEFLIKSSLERKFKSKSFVIGNIILFIILVLGVNIDTVISFFGGDFQDDVEIMVVDNASVYDEFLELFSDDELSELGIKEIKLSDSSADKIQEDVLNDENKIYLVIDKDNSQYITANIICKEGIGTSIKSKISNVLNEIKRDAMLREFAITTDDIEKINEEVLISVDVVSDNNKLENITIANMMQVFTLPLFMLIVYLIQMIGTEVNEEKSTRSMEIIISNVSAKTHFIAKVVAANGFVLIQGLLLVGYAFIGLIIRIVSGGSLNDIVSQSSVSGIFEYSEFNLMASNLIKILPILVIMLVLTFIAYSLLAGVLASMTTSLEDFEQLQTPIMVILLAGYYLSVMAGMFDGSLFMRIMSYVPFISSLLAPTLYVLGDIGIVDVIISMLLLLGVIFLLIKYGFRIYKVGILNYDNTGLWKKIFKSVKEK